MRNCIKSTTPVLKGCCRNIIVVKSPSPMFSDALFILKDELFADNGTDSREILRQAEAAAKQYTAALCPRRKLSIHPALLISPLLSSISAALTFFLLK